MNLKKIRQGTILLLLAAGITATSCKSKEKQADNNPATDTAVTMDNSTVNPVPEIAPDDSLTAGVHDAIKDFPGVTASVSNGEVTLHGGPVSREQLQTLMQAIQSLHPKKVNNNLSIK